MSNKTDDAKPSSIISVLIAMGVVAYLIFGSDNDEKSQNESKAEKTTEQIVPRREQISYVIGEQGLFSDTYRKCDDLIKNSFDFPEHTIIDHTGFDGSFEKVKPFARPDSPNTHSYFLRTYGKTTLASGEEVNFAVDCQLYYSITQDGWSGPSMDGFNWQLYWREGAQYRKK